MPDPLRYARAPSRDRRSLVREGQNFTLTLAPRPSWRTAVFLLIHATIVVYLALLATAPPGTSSIGGMVIQSEGNPAKRVFCGIIAAGWLAACIASIRHFRKWTVIELYDGVLTYTEPGIFRTATRHYTLADYRDAVVGVTDEDGICVELVGRDKKPSSKSLLLGPSGVFYRREDLQFVAELVRDAIRTNRAGGAEPSIPAPVVTTAASGSPPSSAGRTGR